MRKLVLLLGVALVLLAMTIPASAQDDVVISLTVSQFSEDVFSEQIISQFEAQNPGVKAHIVTVSGFGDSFGSEEDVEEYLDAVEDSVSSADVVLVGSLSLNSEATRAGYFLDLAPLVNSDPTMNGDDFYDSVWRSFQWDGGMWAIPVSVDANLLSYDPAAFDAAGLAYPNPNWTIEDFEFAARTLTEFNADGSTASPGFINFGGDVPALFLSLLGQGVTDVNAFPTVPFYDSTELEAILTIYQQMHTDGVMTMPTDEDFDHNSVPMQLSRGAFGGRGFGRGGSNDVELLPSVLPGGGSTLIIDAYAISSGTQHPQEAYELVKFLSNSPEVANAFFGVKPARRSLDGVEPSGGNAGFRIVGGRVTPEMDAAVTMAIENAIPTGETLFSEYLLDALALMNQQGYDARTALDDTEVAVLDRLAVSDARRDTVAITVAPPPSTVELAAGEVRLNFGLASFITPLPNQNAWDQAAIDFAASDPEVGQVILNSSLPNDVEEIAETNDCFYMETNIVQGADLSILRSIDPLLASDPAFDPNDMVGNVMVQVQRNNQTWAMPLMIQPAAMRYDVEIFSWAGAYQPEGSWTVDQFEDGLQLLKYYLGDEVYPYRPNGSDNAHWLMLIAAYGGLPFDYRLDPATVNFTDPATVEAIREVLNMAKDGYIEYSELAGSVGNFSIRLGGGNDDIALYSEVLNSFSIAGIRGAFGRGRGGGNNQNQPQSAENTDVLTSFPGDAQYTPSGSQYTAVSYDLAAAYISANSLYADACYRFISQIAQNPELIPVMPARSSLINSYELEAAQGEDNVQFYNALDALMQMPNTINIPTIQSGGARGGISQIFDSYWLNRAFDRYVLEDADLETELADAQTYTVAYQECVAAIPPLDPTVDDQFTYFQQFIACATLVDPTAATNLR